MKFILGIKKEMTQKFLEDGTVVPVTVVVASACVVTQLKNKAKDGYSAVQIGSGTSKNLSKPQKGHLKGLAPVRYSREFRILEDELKDYEVGKTVDLSVFQKGQKVTVSAKSKGRGFQGVVKRHGFHGQDATHGHKDQLRMPGSIGDGGSQHVKKGRRMGGRMGDAMVTVANLEIVDIDAPNNLLYLKGALPGGRNSFLRMRTAE